MAQHARLKIDAGVQVYFCDPQSPRQRGTNENTNGLARPIAPCQQCMTQLSDERRSAAASGRLSSTKESDPVSCIGTCDAMS